MTISKEKRPKSSDKAIKDVFMLICEQTLKIEVVSEFQFHPTRKWRFDYAIPNLKIALEVEGGAWTNGRHTRGGGFIADMEKYNTGTLLGWRIFRVTPATLITDKTFKMLDSAIKFNQ